jgi:hypothetical protein
MKHVFLVVVFVLFGALFLLAAYKSNHAAPLLPAATCFVLAIVTAKYKHRIF